MTKALLALSGLAWSGEGVAAQSIEGVLLERGSDRPVDLAIVTLMTVEGDSVMSILTDESGRFDLLADQAGDYLLAAAAWGYETTVAGSVFTLGRDSRFSLEFRIPRAALELPGLVVLADGATRRHPLEMNGFVDRARKGFGTFITPAQIAESGAFSTTDLLRRTGRVMIESEPGRDRLTMRGSVGGRCDPFIYLDGRRISLEGMPLEALVPVRYLEAAEVYRSSVEAPPQYSVGVFRCGVILLWTRTR